MGVGDLTMCKILGSDGGVSWQTTLHYRTLTSFGTKEQELLALVDALKENLIFKQLTNDALDFMHIGNYLTGLQLRDVDDDTIGLDSSIGSGDGQGKLTGENKANILAVLGRKATDKIGRSYQGRNYWNFLSEETLQGDVIVQFVASDILAWLSTLLAIAPALPLHTFQLVVYSPTLGLSTAVTSAGIRGRMKHQESRSN